MAKRKSAFERSESIRAMLDEAEQADAEAQRQTSGQGKPGHAGRIGVDKRGTSKATYNLPLDALILVEKMAEEYDVPKNDVIHAAIVLLHNAQAANPKLLADIRVPARLLTAGYRLSIPADFYFSPPASQP